MAGEPSASAPDPAEAASVHAARLRFGVLCVLAYVALSWSFRFDMRLGKQMVSLVYPLDTFSMYATTPGDRASRLLIRDADGRMHHIEDFRSYDCAEPVTGSEVRCADRLGIDYIHEELTRYIETHGGPGEREVELVARTWVIRRGESPIHESDCVVAHCRVTP